MINLNYWASQIMSMLKLEASFVIRGRGLVLIPVLPLPTTDRFQPFDTRVNLCRPDGTEREFEAEFHVEHFYLKGGRGKSSISALLPHASKADAPEGTELEVTEETFALLRGRTVHKRK
jgi:hypothetical protein